MTRTEFHNRHPAFLHMYSDQKRPQHIHDRLLVKQAFTTFVEAYSKGKRKEYNKKN